MRHGHTCVPWLLVIHVPMLSSSFLGVWFTTSKCTAIHQTDLITWDSSLHLPGRYPLTMTCIWSIYITSIPPLPPSTNPQNGIAVPTCMCTTSYHYLTVHEICPLFFHRQYMCTCMIWYTRLFSSAQEGRYSGVVVMWWSCYSHVMVTWQSCDVMWQSCDGHVMILISTCS